MARTRDYAAENRAREQRARELGFTSDYDRRVRGGAAASPSSPKPSGSELARRAGHRGRAALLADVREGDLVSVVSTDRNPDGTYRRMVISVIDADGNEREYWLRRDALLPASILSLSQLIDAAGAVQAPAYPLLRFYDELDEDMDELEQMGREQDFDDEDEAA